VFEAKRSELNQKNEKKLNTLQNIIFNSPLAEDLYVSFLEESIETNTSQKQILDAIFEAGLKKRTKFTESFVETIKSMDQHGFTSDDLKPVVEFLKAKSAIDPRYSHGNYPSTIHEVEEENHYRDSTSSLIKKYKDPDSP
jgi:hypothetical protein